MVMISRKHEIIDRLCRSPLQINTASWVLIWLGESRGGISLLHLSWGHPRRALPVILALRSPDFPHVRPFGLHARLLGLLDEPIVIAVRLLVNHKPILPFKRLRD